MSNPPTKDEKDERDGAGWRAYYAATQGRPPRPTLLRALDAFARPGRAADLGCGDGRDAIAMLQRGWSVVAIDAEPAGLARLKARCDLPPDARLTLVNARFEDAAWPAADLVNSSFALPNCPPERFPALWQKIGTSLAAGGRFAGQLYGTRDSWAARPGMVFFGAAEARALFAARYAIELFDEEETDAVTPRGEAKHWHIFHVVARKL